MTTLILSGIAIGILASAPLGPAGILCVQRTLTRGWGRGFLSGCGIALADTIFSIIAVSSLSFIVSIVKEVETPLQLIVGVIVICVGLNIATRDPVKQFHKSRVPQKKGTLAAFFSIFLLTLNPVNLLPVLFFTGAFKVGVEAFWEGALVVGGVVCGAVAWWLGITSLVAHYRSRFRPRHILLINRILGFFVSGLGVSACVMAVVKFVEQMP
jgi:threonine/homoserine/homoserine lactone efflux protein